jgi:hypothetical protein
MDHVAFDGYYGIRERWNSKTSERSPHEWRRWKKLLYLLLIGRANCVSNKYRAAERDSTIQK